MEEAPENGKELSHSAHANGMKEWMNEWMNILQPIHFVEIITEGLSENITYMGLFTTWNLNLPVTKYVLWVG